MARFKKRFKRYTSRAVKMYKSSRKPTLSVADVLIAGAAYGALRPMAANVLPNFFSFGPVDSDNVLIGGVGYLASKSNTKLVKTFGLVSMAGEAGIIASRVIQGQSNTSSTSSFNW